MFIVKTKAQLPWMHSFVPPLLRNKDNFQAVIGEREDADGDNQYLIKIKGKPYKESIWISKKLFFELKLSKSVLPQDVFPNFDKNHVYNPDFDKIEYAIIFSKHGYFVKWKSLPLEEATFVPNLTSHLFSVFDRRKKAKFSKLKFRRGGNSSLGQFAKSNDKMKLRPMTGVNKILQVPKSMSNPIHKTNGVFEGFGIDH